MACTGLPATRQSQKAGKATSNEMPVRPATVLLGESPPSCILPSEAPDNEAPTGMALNELAKEAEIVFTLSDGTQSILKIENNHQALLRLPIPQDTAEIAVRSISSWGGEGVGLFACDLC